MNAKAWSDRIRMIGKRVLILEGPHSGVRGIVRAYEPGPAGTADKFSVEDRGQAVLVYCDQVVSLESPK